MKIALVQIGKTTDKNISEVAEIYSGRIKRYSSFEIITLPELKNVANVPVGEQKIREGVKFLQIVNSDDYVILMDERGKEFRTIEFTVMLEKLFMLQKKRILFVIGGPWGFSDDVYNRADMKMSLSKMTFPHQLVRLLFLEQLYRVFTVIKGEPYHHE